VTELDTRIFLFLREWLSGGWTMPMVICSAVGGGWGAIALVPLFASIRTRRFAGSLAVVLVMTATLVYVLKAIVGRVRPYASVSGVTSIFFDPPTDYSFPSGHTAGSFAFAMFVAIVLVKTAPNEIESAAAGTGMRLNRAVRYGGAATLFLFANAVGLSRIALGVHFPGDVLAGAIIGATIASVGANIHLRRSRRTTASLQP
jgi:undecaprenyl-diphosphatase